MKKGRRLVALLPLGCLIFSVLAWAQTDTARIVGTVKDSTGGVIPDATVKVTS